MCNQAKYLKQIHFACSHVLCSWEKLIRPPSFVSCGITTYKISPWCIKIRKHREKETDRQTQGYSASPLYIHREALHKSGKGKNVRMLSSWTIILLPSSRCFEWLHLAWAPLGAFFLHTPGARTETSFQAIFRENHRLSSISSSVPLKFNC